MYKFLDAMCGDSGAGTLKKEILIQRLQGSIDTIYGSDLDYIFGNMRFLSRTTSESYPYDPMTDMLTSDAWDEIRVKDAWYRARITEYFVACALGSQADGIRHAVHAAVSVDAEVMEVWRYIDNFGLTVPLGRAGGARNEVVVRPYKTSLDPREFRLLREMLTRFTPEDTILTINTSGLAVASPIPTHAVSADSTYYQVEKVVTGTPLLEQIPAPELLAIDLDPTEKWLFSNSPELAPYAQFNISSEYGYHYLVSGGTRSPIDAVTYETLRPDGTLATEANFVFYETTGLYSDWYPYEIADSPDNFPGGKYGIHPHEAPALNPDQSAYHFPYPDQATYVATKKAEVLTLGGIATDSQYRLPVEKPNQSKRAFTPDLAIAYSAPARDSTVTSSCTARRPRRRVFELRLPSIFVRS